MNVNKLSQTDPWPFRQHYRLLLYLVKIFGKIHALAENYLDLMALKYSLEKVTHQTLISSVAHLFTC